MAWRRLSILPETQRDDRISASSRPTEWIPYLFFVWLSGLPVIKYNSAYIFTAGTDCWANEKLPRQSRLTSSRVFVEAESSIASPPLALHLLLFSNALYFLLSCFPASTCRAAAAVSRASRKRPFESIEAWRKLTTTGWLVLLFY